MITLEERFVKALLVEANEQLESIRQRRIFEGHNPDYISRAKLAIGVIGAYVHLRGTMANDTHNSLIERRLDREDATLKLSDKSA